MACIVGTATSQETVSDRPIIDRHLGHSDASSVSAYPDGPYVSLSCELFNPSFERCEKDATLDVYVPVPMQRKNLVMFIGAAADNKNFNFQNWFSTAIRYGLMFDLGSRTRELFLTTALGAGLEYDHIDMASLTSTGSDPYFNDLPPNRTRFLGQVGLAIHNRHFRVSLYSQRLTPDLRTSPLSLSGSWFSNEERKVRCILSATGSIIPGNGSLSGNVHASLIIGSPLIIGVQYCSDNRLYLEAGLRIKALRLQYGCGFQAFRFKAGGEPFLSHHIGLSISIDRENKQSDNY